MSIGLLAKRSQGVRLHENKLTEKNKIEQAPLPKQVIIPMVQHLGAPANIIINKADEIKTGQKIGEISGFISANIHSTISGKVKKISEILKSTNLEVLKSVLIESDGNDEWITMEKIPDWKSKTNEELLTRIKEAGIVGLGGATFPTHIKLNPPADKKIKIIILNGCECEPYITSDHRTMLEYGEKIVEGMQIIMKLLDCNNVYIAIEKNKQDAIEHMRNLISKSNLKNVKISVMKTKYPMGAEKTLVKVLLGEEVPIGGLPLDVGVVVQNVSTVKAIYEAICEGKPLIEGVVTVTGSVKQPKNLMVRFGTPIKDIIEYCGGIVGDADEIICGGPMMGVSQYNLDMPIVKGTNCVLVKKAEVRNERDCIRCSSCIDGCPMNLMPTMYVSLVKNNRYEDCANYYYIDNCVECGSCAYSCPSKIPIVQYIKIAKNELMKMRKKNATKK